MTDWICDDRGIDEMIEMQRKIQKMSDEEFEKFLSESEGQEKQEKVDVVA